jgi:hypothetical protein
MIKSELFPPVKTLKLVYNNPETVMDFPLEQMYKKEFVDAVEWISTPTCEGFGKDVQRRVRDLKKGECVIYVLDSADALVSEAAAERMEKILDGKKVDGTYGVEKAKFFSSEFFSHLCGITEGKDFTLIIISQVRENIGVSFGEKYRRTGGKALDFYTHAVVWLSTYEKMKRTFRSQEKIYGVRVRANCKRNKVFKPFRQADYVITFDFGIDDTWSLLDYLFGPKAKEYEWNDEKYKKEDLISFLEENPEELEKLKQIVEKDWLEIEAEIAPKRKDRWG